MRSCRTSLLAWLLYLAIGIMITERSWADGLEGKEKPAYVFKPEVRKVTRQVGPDEFHLGHLDEWGDFVPDFKKSPTKWEKLGGLLKDYPLYNNQTGIRPDPIFEYRSGFLIPGTLDGFFFVPQVGRKIVRMEDYLKAYPASDDLT